MIDFVKQVVRRMVPGWLLVTDRPIVGTIKLSYNSPGPIEQISYDVLVDYGDPNGQQTLPNVRPINSEPLPYDVFAAPNGSECQILWEGNTPKVTTVTPMPVTSACNEPPPP